MNGGRDLATTVRTIMDGMLTNSLATQFNWKRNRGKKAFEDLLLCKVLRRKCYCAISHLSVWYCRIPVRRHPDYPTEMRQISIGSPATVIGSVAKPGTIWFLVLLLLLRHELMECPSPSTREKGPVQPGALTICSYHIFQRGYAIASWNRSVVLSVHLFYRGEPQKPSVPDCYR